MVLGWVEWIPTVAVMVSDLQVPEFYGIAGQQRMLLILARPFEQGMGRADPGREAATQRADRPVRTPDHAVEAEGIDRVFGIGADRVERPGRGIGIGDDAREL